MDCGFIQAVAPASQPVPLTDAAGSPDAFAETAASFDAALSQTLATEGGGASGAAAPSNGARSAQPAWLLASLFTSTMTALTAATEAVTEGELAVAQEGERPAGEIAEEEPTGDTTACADVVVPTPWVVDVKEAAPAIVPEAAIGGTTGDAAAKGNLLAGDMKANAPRSADQTNPKTASVPGANTARIAAAAVSADTKAVATGAAAVPPGATTVPESAVAAATGDAATTGGAATAAVAVGTDVTSAEGSKEQVPARGVTRAVGAAPFAQVTASPEQTQQAVPTAARPDVQPAAADIAAAVTAGVAPTDAARTQSAESAAAIEMALPGKGTANQDAMAGQDQPNGQGRPSQEFMRFTAALAQVSPAAGEDAGRAPASVVAASAAPAPAAAVTTPIAAAAPAPTTSAETPGPENVGRLVQAMRVIARPGAWEANVRLNPEHLGEVSIAVRVERNTVSAVVNAEAVGVRQWLESQEQAVRNGMAEHGLQLDRFIVQRDGQRRDAEPQQQESRRQAPRRQAAPTERFEIVV